MRYSFEFRPYQRKFKRSLLTSHGRWEVREGIILRLTDQTGQVGWGEIAPIAWFGSETLQEARDFCASLPEEITATKIFSIPSQLPACQFGFESAWEGLARQTSKVIPPQSFPFNGKDLFPTPVNRKNLSFSCSTHTYSYLLPTGEAAMQAWQEPWNQGSCTFKWKIGVSPIAEELRSFQQLTQALPAGTKLRLDANGGLTLKEAEQWLQAADQAGMIEFIEQPLPPEQFHRMLGLSAEYATPLALDESVATLRQLEACYQRGWRGIFVIKVAIAGSPKCLRQFCDRTPIDAVFSSVFETAIGKQAALNLAAELSQNDRAVGFGVDDWFDEDKETWLEQLWKHP
jgi:O-succinylbenzoate synthase